MDDHTHLLGVVHEVIPLSFTHSRIFNAMDLGLQKLAPAERRKALEQLSSPARADPQGVSKIMAIERCYKYVSVLEIVVLLHEVLRSN